MGLNLIAFLSHLHKLTIDLPSDTAQKTAVSPLKVNHTQLLFALENDQHCC